MALRLGTDAMFGGNNANDDIRMVEDRLRP